MRLVHPQKSSGKRIITIIGGGFAGLNAAKALADQPEVEVVLIDQRNHHLFQPLLYQVATAGLNPSDIAVPIRSQFSDNSNVEVHLGKIAKINLEDKTISTTENTTLGETITLEYDYLIMACGARHSYFANPEWEEFAPGLKTVEQALEIRKRILTIFELAENEIDPAARNEYLNFVVVGGGPTGVELAGAIADLSRTVLVKDFKQIDPSQTQVTLIEAGPRILASFSEDLSRKAAEALTHLGVQIRLNSRVENINHDGVHVGGEVIKSKCVLWGAGVQASPMSFDKDIAKDRAGRIIVNQDLSIPGHPEVFVVGDQASIKWEDGKIVPGLAPAAIQTGNYAAQKILADIRHETLPVFKYHDKGQMATIGKHEAVMEAGRLKSQGFFAWVAWLFVHIYYIVGFKNRFSVFAQWCWNYIFSKRGSRLITENEWRLK